MYTTSMYTISDGKINYCCIVIQIYVKRKDAPVWLDVLDR